MIALIVVYSIADNSGRKEEGGGGGEEGGERRKGRGGEGRGGEGRGEEGRLRGKLKCCTSFCAQDYYLMTALDIIDHVILISVILTLPKYNSFRGSLKQPSWTSYDWRMVSGPSVFDCSYTEGVGH